MKTLISLATMLVLLIPNVSHANFSRVCRGASLYKYDNAIKQAVKAKLVASGIAFKRVNIEYTGVVRSHDKYANDFFTDLTVSSGDTPSVSFTGAFPDLTPCTIPLNVRITVVYPNGAKSITVNPTTAPGTLLPALAPGSNKTDE